jgi:type II secretory pathway pseudopilin PulG
VAISMLRPAQQSHKAGKPLGFSLVELLTVVAIMMILMGFLVVSLSQSQGRSVQVAAGQVASGLAATRQIAIMKNTQAALVFAPSSNAAGNSLLPDEAYRYFAIVYSNTTTGNWILVKDWEPLAPGAVFFNILKANYSPLTWPTVTAQVGDEITPTVQNSTNNLRISLEGTPAKVEGTLTGAVPLVMFNPDGGATGVGAQGMGVGIAEGAALPSGKIVVRSLANLAYVEVDSIIGKAVVKMREAYK